MFIDILFLVVATTGFFAGYRKGLVGALLNIIAIVVALLGAAKFSPWLIDLLEGMLPNIDPRIYMIVGFLISFMLIMAGIKWVGRNLERGLKEVHLDFMNKMGGGLLFFLLNTVVFSTALWILKDFSLLSPEKFSDSVTYPTLEKIPAVLAGYMDSIKPIFQEFWDRLSLAGMQLKEGAQ